MMISPKSPAPPRRVSNNIPHLPSPFESNNPRDAKMAPPHASQRNFIVSLTTVSPRLSRFAKLASHRFREGLSKALHRFRLYLNNLPIILVAMLPARLPEDNALPAMFEAWLNLSQRENARELVTVRTSAIATGKEKRQG